MSRLRLIAAMAVALVLVLPATALAATFEVSGTVTDKDGAPVASAEVTVLVQGTDTILATTTDESGAWALQIDAEPGAVLEVNGTGPGITSDPDENGCVTTTTGSGQVLATLPAEGQADPVAVALENEISGTVCTATATPDAPEPAAPAQEQKPDPQPGITPPATDAIASSSGPAGGNGTLLLVGGLAAFLVLVVASTAPRRARRR